MSHYHFSTVEELTEFFYDHCNENTEGLPVKLMIGDKLCSIKAGWIETVDDADPEDEEATAIQIVLQAED